MITYLSKHNTLELDQIRVSPVTGNKLRIVVIESIGRAVFCLCRTASNTTIRLDAIELEKYYDQFIEILPNTKPNDEGAYIGVPL